MDEYEALKAAISELGGALIAFSGGVDSSLLLAAARDVLDQRVLAVTVDSPVYPAWELEQARATARALDARHRVVEVNELADAAFRANTPDRCYVCKKRRFSHLKEIALQEGIDHILEGSNKDDLDEYRPGLRAAEELRVRSPFIGLGIGKQAIREMARARGLAVWNRPATSCLATRIPFGEKITAMRIRRVERAEERLAALGFRRLRVRDHGNLARIEVDGDEIERLLDPVLREQVQVELRAAGYTYVSLDLRGYRSGSMDESLDLPDRR